MATTGGDGAMGDLRGVDSPASRLHLPELSAAQIGRAVEHSSVAVMITDVNGRIEYVNQCFSRTTGYPLAEIVGKTPSILKSGHTLAADYRKLWSTIRRGDDWRGEFCNRRRDGTLYWSSATISAVKGAGGAITHFVAIQVDIGERKRVEQELRQSEQRFRSLVENSLLGICIERNGKPLFVNQSFAEIHGYDNPTEIIQLGSLTPLYVPDDLTRVFQSRRKRARGRMPLQYELRGVKKDGSIVWLQTQTMTVSWNGEPAAQTTVIDVTARKRMTGSTLRAFSKSRKASAS